MDREIANQWCERIIFALVLGILSFSSLAIGAVQPFQFAVVEGLTLLAGLAWVVRLWFAPERKLIWSPVCWGVLLFVFYAVFRYFGSDVEWLARQELFRVLTYALLFFIVLNNIQQGRSLQIFSIWMVVLAACISGYAIYQFGSGSTHIWHYIKPASYMGRAGGTFVNPNHLAGFIGMILPVGLTLVLLARLNHVAKVFIAYACLVMVGGLFVTISRGGWLAVGGTLLALAVILLMKPGRKVIPTLAILIVVVVVGAGVYKKSPRFQARVMRTFDEKGKVLDLRTRLWDAALSMWKESPMVGVGPGHYDYRYGKYRVGDWRSQARPVYAHNDYLNTLADWGVIGVTLVGGIFVLVGFGAFRTHRVLVRSNDDIGRRPSNREAILIGGSMGLLAMLLHAVVEFNMQVPANAMLAVTWLAILTGLRRYEGRSKNGELTFVQRLAIALPVLVVVVVLGKDAFRKTSEDRYLEEARKLPFFSEERLTALKKAHTADPGNFETTYLIGEYFRQKSFRGEADYEKAAREAMQWFLRSMDLNRYAPMHYVRYGMCLDWLGQHDKAYAFYEKALQVDGRNYHIATYMGWHFLQFEDYVNARKWFEQSLQLNNNYMGRNQTPENYIKLIERRLRENAAPVELSIPPSS